MPPEITPTSVPDVTFEAFEFEGCKFLGPLVRLSLAPRMTVLVGKNGAGKSALIDAILLCAQVSTGGTLLRSWALESFPTRFACDFILEGRPLRYEFRQQPLKQEASSSVDKPNPPAPMKWSEACWDRGTNERLWEVDDAVGRSGRHHISLQAGAGLLSIVVPEDFPSAAIVRALSYSLARTRRVQAGVPRQGISREPAIQFRDSGSHFWRLSGVSRVDTIAAALLNWKERESETFDEFVAIGKRMGVWKKVTTTIYKMPNEPAAVSNAGRMSMPQELAFVGIDGVDLGFVSDGTTRIAEIVRLLLTPAKLLLVEEPETSIHPGLLRKLLAEIESYADGRQVIITTHSPQVVTAARPPEIRLVEREKAATSVKELTAENVARVSKYLHDEGTLGEFVFQGPLED
jgi:predicted ATPase